MNTHRGVSVRGCVDGRRRGEEGSKKKKSAKENREFRKKEEKCRVTLSGLGLRCEGIKGTFKKLEDDSKIS